MDNFSAFQDKQPMTLAIEGVAILRLVEQGWRYKSLSNNKTDETIRGVVKRFVGSKDDGYLPTSD